MLRCRLENIFDAVIGSKYNQIVATNLENEMFIILSIGFLAITFAAGYFLIVAFVDDRENSKVPKPVDKMMHKHHTRGEW